MRITKRQLRRIIKEEKEILGSRQRVLPSLRVDEAWPRSKSGELLPQAVEDPSGRGDINLYEALDAYISEAIQAAIDETGADPNLPAVRSTIEKALNAYITRNYR